MANRTLAPKRDLVFPAPMPVADLSPAPRAAAAAPHAAVPIPAPARARNASSKAALTVGIVFLSVWAFASYFQVGNTQDRASAEALKVIALHQARDAKFVTPQQDFAALETSLQALKASVQALEASVALKCADPYSEAGVPVTERAAEQHSTANGIKILQRALPRSAAAIKAAYKHRVAAQRESWWTASAAAQKLQRVDKGGTSAHVRRLYEDLPRRQASLLTQLRTGHVGLRGFLARIKVEPSARCEQCGTPETVEHYLIHCPRFNPARHTLRMRLKKPLSLPLLLNTPSSIPALLRYIHDTNRFPDYHDDISHLPPLSKPQP